MLFINIIKIKNGFIKPKSLVYQRIKKIPKKKSMVYHKCEKSLKKAKNKHNKNKKCLKTALECYFQWYTTNKKNNKTLVYQE